MLAIIEWNEDTYLHPTLFKKGDRIQVDVENKGGTVVTIENQKHFLFKSTFKVVPLDEIEMITQEIEKNLHNPEGLTKLVQKLKGNS